MTGQTIQFCLGPSLISHDVHVMCDYPQAKQPFQRDNYHELDWSCNRGDQYDPDRHADIPIERAGTFRFFYFSTVDNHESVNMA